jgi:hypothetical protein
MPKAAPTPKAGGAILPNIHSIAARILILELSLELSLVSQIHVTSSIF